MNTAGKVIIGLLAGAATGAILGILLAPDKGSETRRKIAEKSKDFKEDMKNKFEDILENTKKKFETNKGEDHEPNVKSKTEMV